MKFGLASVIALCSVVTAGAVSLSLAQQMSAQEPAASFPTRPVQIVVPFAAGGSSDVVVRMLVQTVSKSWNQPVVIDNRVGATGAIAGEYVVRQPADGYTLLNAAPTSHTALRALRHDLTYNPMSDLTPVTLLVIAPMMLVVNPTKVPARTVPELIDYLKKNPGKLTYASTGIGSVAHLSVELFKILTETDMVHVPYRGNAPALTDLLAGNVDLTIDVSSSVASHLKSGALRSLGVTTAKRSSFDPDMPAVAEAVPGFQAFSWNGIVVRTGTPPSIIEKVCREFASAVQQPHVKEMLARILMEPVGSSPAEFHELMKADAARWDRVVSALNLNPGQK